MSDKLSYLSHEWQSIVSVTRVANVSFCHMSDKLSNLSHEWQMIASVTRVAK